MLKFFLLLSLLALSSGCSALQPLAPTPVIIVVTATPEAQATLTAAATTNVLPTVSADTTQIPQTLQPSVEPPGATRTDFPIKPTDVKYVRAKEDINIRKGPGTIYDIVGGVYAGQTAQVTGFKSDDDKWWRVICPDGTTGDCWVSADPGLTEPTTAPNTLPTTAPNAQPTATTSIVVDVETFVRQLSAALQNKNYNALSGMMDESFTVAYWLSEGVKLKRDEATTRLQNEWLGPANNVVVDIANKTDQIGLLNGTNPLSMWDPKAKVLKSVYVKGLGSTQTDQALLIIAQRADRSVYWYGMLYAAQGFVK